MSIYAFIAFCAHNRQFFIALNATIQFITMDVHAHSYYYYYYYYRFFVSTIDFPLLWSHVITLNGKDEEMADKEDSEKTIAEDLVVTKYKMAGDIVNRK